MSSLSVFNELGVNLFQVRLLEEAFVEERKEDVQMRKVLPLLFVMVLAVAVVAVSMAAGKIVSGKDAQALNRTHGASRLSVIGPSAAHTAHGALASARVMPEARKPIQTVLTQAKKPGRPR
jgi:hypothetical protein